MSAADLRLANTLTYETTNRAEETASSDVCSVSSSGTQVPEKTNVSVIGK